MATSLAILRGTWLPQNLWKFGLRLDSSRTLRFLNVIKPTPHWLGSSTTSLRCIIPAFIIVGKACDVPGRTVERLGGCSELGKQNKTETNKETPTLCGPSPLLVYLYALIDVGSPWWPSLVRRYWLYKKVVWTNHGKQGSKQIPSMASRIVLPLGLDFCVSLFPGLPWSWTVTCKLK